MQKIIIPDKPSSQEIRNITKTLEREMTTSLKIGSLVFVSDGYSNLRTYNCVSQRNGKRLFEALSKYLEPWRVKTNNLPLLKPERIQLLSVIFETDCSQAQNNYLSRARYYSSALLALKDCARSYPEEPELFQQIDSLESCCNTTILIFNNITRANQLYKNGGAVLDNCKF